MRNSEIVREVLHSRGEQGLPITRLYRQLYNRKHYLQAYRKIYSNQGATTPGITKDTVDGMSLKRINQIIKRVRYARYQWTPVRRVQIPKKDGRKRPLGLPTWSDKLLQETIRSLLEFYYEPTFSNKSHGFRPNRGCHTALTELTSWTGVKWFIEGDIKGCFDNIDHNILLNILAEKIHDQRFLDLIRKLLRTGYIEDWKYRKTLSGTPQGGIVSPLLSNVYLDKFDKFIERKLIPEYTKGTKRQINPDYRSLTNTLYRAKKKKDYTTMHEIALQRRLLPSKDTHDPGFRRLWYVRYADDFLLGFIGPKSEAQEIKQKIKEFLENQLKLTLSEEKTLITHAHGDRARFLGYEISTMHENTKLTKGRRSINGKIQLRIPPDVIKDKRRKYMCNGKPTPRTYLIHDSDYSTIAKYQVEFSGIVQYYQLAHNIHDLDKLKYIMERSLTATLACKLDTTRRQIYRKYQTTYTHPNGKTYKILEVRIKRDEKKDLIARWGGIPLIRNPRAPITDSPSQIWTNKGAELLQRLLAEKCEICGLETNIEVHHIRALKDLKKKGQKEPPFWKVIMSARKRKTLVVCHRCHTAIHNGRKPQCEA